LLTKATSIAALNTRQKWKKLAIIFRRYDLSLPFCRIASRNLPLEKASMIAIPPRANPNRLGAMLSVNAAQVGFPSGPTVVHSLGRTPVINSDPQK